MKKLFLTLVALYAIQMTHATIGSLPGRFVVNASGSYIAFSKGNLQYQATTETWRFAEQQYYYVGDGNQNISSTYSGWIDLFGWATSGYKGIAPITTSTSYSSYGENGQIADIKNTPFDWGVHNAISNGGGVPNLWRVLTWDEWNYLADNHPSGQATVCDVHGYIILPDNFVLPTGLTFVDTRNMYSNDRSYSCNVYDSLQWVLMEEAGAVFLPAAGRRAAPTYMVDVESRGYYWSSNAKPIWLAYSAVFGKTFSLCHNATAQACADGLSVRLVQNTNPITTHIVNENVPELVTGQKILYNGQIFILRGEKTYTLTGQELK